MIYVYRWTCLQCVCVCMPPPPIVWSNSPIQQNRRIHSSPSFRLSLQEFPLLVIIFKKVGGGGEVKWTILNRIFFFFFPKSTLLANNTRELKIKQKQSPRSAVYFSCFTSIWLGYTLTRISLDRFSFGNLIVNRSRLIQVTVYNRSETPLGISGLFSIIFVFE